MMTRTDLLSLYRERYTAIHSFFSSLQRPSPQIFHRSFSTSATKRRDFSGRDKESREDHSVSHNAEDEYVNDRRQQPFHNYPRSLRELAIRAREEGTLEARNALQAAQEKQSHDDDPDKADKINQTDDKSFSSRSRDATPKSTSRWTRSRPPSKEDLLRFSQGFWTRLRIRFKWFTIRGFRRFNADDISAFFTLGGLGTVIFIIVGTTTAVSLVFTALNILNMQGWIARKIADYLTHETGVTVIFESAIVPKWKESRICFQNVFISRRAYGHDYETLKEERNAIKAKPESKKSRLSKARKRLTAITAGQGMAWEGTHYNEYDEEEVAPPMSDIARGEVSTGKDQEVNNNFSMFDLNVDSFDVKLSFSRWLDGKGLVEDVVVQGVRGIIGECISKDIERRVSCLNCNCLDRRNVYWDPEKPYDPREARRQRKPGGFELASLTVNDFLVTVYQPGDFRPFNLSVFEAQMLRLRRQWLFYDILSADRITGQVDGCLFSLHKPQSIGRTTGREKETTAGRWKTLSRLRIDGINFDHIQNQSDVHGPVSWILSGKFDVVADIKFPKDTSSDIDINVIISEMLDNLSQAVAGENARNGLGSVEDGPIPGQHRLSGPAIQAPVTTVGPAAEGAWKKRERELELLREESKAKQINRGWRKEMNDAAEAVSANREAVAVDEDNQLNRDTSTLESAKIENEEVKEALVDQVGEQHAKDAIAISPNAASVVIDLDVRFKDIKAAVPLFASDLTYRTQTFVRPIVAFMNANQTLIPVHCRVVMDLVSYSEEGDRI